MNRSIRGLILLLCVLHGSHAKADEQHTPHETQNQVATAIPYDAELVATLGADSKSHGDAARGAAVFSNAKLACLSCHKISSHGGSVGPDLTAIAKDRSLPHLNPCSGHAAT